MALDADPRLNAFYTLSAALTGFEHFDLVGTGLGPTYFQKVVDGVPEPQLNALLSRWESVLKEYPEASPDRTAILTDLVQAPELGASAKQITLLWYTGSWYDADLSTSNVVEGNAYVEGLMWQAIDAHPMAAKPQGFGAWALPPKQL